MGEPKREAGLPEWVANVFAVVDAGDARRFAGFFTEDGAFRFGNAPPVVGRAAIEAAVAGFFGSIRSCRHRLLRFWEADGRCAMDGEVTYLRLDGRELTLPFANVFVLREGRIAQYLVFVDLAPLFAD
jgi:ketosteroid isomerase-like protein